VGSWGALKEFVLVCGGSGGGDDLRQMRELAWLGGSCALKRGSRRRPAKK